jgi:hypothetical protein
MTKAPVILLSFWLVGTAPLLALDPCEEQVVGHIRIDPGHPWLPPFGLERVGKPLEIVVEVTSAKRPEREYSVVSYLEGKEVGRHALTEINSHSPAQNKYVENVRLSPYPTEVALFAKCRYQGEPVEIARLNIEPPILEAEAVAHPQEVTNPVDLGTIFVPHDWLLLRSGQKALVEVAALSRAQDAGASQVSAWFESAPKGKVSVNLKLAQGNRTQAELATAPVTAAKESDVLHVALTDAGGKEIWHKKIQTMVVAKPPQLPSFGATELKLRYDMPISVRDLKTGDLSTMPYSEGWDPKLNDVVITLPSGARFVFWRGSSYVPFWAGKYNTGLSYEWAETTPPPDGFVDSVEPLMDKELRYGRVQIMESTPARVHVRWSYQSCDFTYKVWGDSAVEDFYLYPDGYGTRVLTLQSTPGVNYELSEFIILTPAQAYPFDVLPRQQVDAIFLDGEKKELSFPYIEGPKGRNYTWPEELKEKVRATPIIYRVRIGKQEEAAGIYFNPLDPHLPPHIFSPFFDRGYMVTRNYWGSHWPLARGKSTGWTIDDRIHYSPSHNSVMSWGMTSQPAPVSSATVHTLDTLGRVKPMLKRRWAWLIGMSTDSDARLLQWARSFSRPPALEVKGARLETPSYVPERRAIRLVVEDQAVSIAFQPVFPCVNPVLELAGASPALARATLGGRPLDPKEYAWDGKTLWLGVTIEQPQELRLEFGKTAR